MTEKEAIGIWLPMVLMAVHDSPQCEEAVKMAGRALEQESILDKIRAEIETKYDSIPWRNNDYDDGWVEALEWVLDNVIDKYMEVRSAKE